ncbi:hypothetical protein [Acuticoccus sp.]|uniref:hypothetical protein n=1 Tax=Acuticoccus sp. TaxID=1904378 RepID=UPI003B5184F8
MTEKTLVPVPDGDERRPATRNKRLERRQKALAERKATAAAVPAHDRDALPVEVPAPRNDAFVLPPRAQLTKSASMFGQLVKASLFLCVVLPTFLTVLFYAAMASPQFATESKFAVRGSSSSTGAMDMGGLFSAAGGSVDSEIADSFILQEFIGSRAMVEVLVAEANFLEIYSRPSADFYYRLDPSLPVEKLVDYWRMMSEAEYDTDTGIITLIVRAFRPRDAEVITAKVIEQSEELVNELSRRSREDSLASARREVELAEARYGDSRKAVAAYRGDEREIDPTAVAKARQGVVSGLEAEVATLQSQLTALRATMSENSPRVVYVSNQIDALQRQIAAERLRVAASEDGSDQAILTDRLSRYEELVAEQQFAEQSYLSSMETMEMARMEAMKQQRYLAVFVRGSAPERATYPDALRWTLVLLISLVLVWGLITVVCAAVRDRVV